MAQHDHDDDAHAHHGAHDHAHLPYDEAKVESEITVDRERMFDMFIKITAWHVVGIFFVLALLALTQT